MSADELTEPNKCKRTFFNCVCACACLFWIQCLLLVFSPFSCMRVCPFVYICIFVHVLRRPANALCAHAWHETAYAIGCTIYIYRAVLFPLWHCRYTDPSRWFFPICLVPNIGNVWCVAVLWSTYNIFLFLLYHACVCTSVCACVCMYVRGACMWTRAFERERERERCDCQFIDSDLFYMNLF